MQIENQHKGDEYPRDAICLLFATHSSVSFASRNCARISDKEALLA